MQKMSFKLCSVLIGVITTLFILFLVINKFFLHNQNAIMTSLNPPETYQLGNYFELQKMYSLIIKKNYGQDISDKSLNNDIFNKFWQRAISRDNRYNFWLDNQYFKQRMTGDNAKDLAQLNDLIDKWRFNDKTHSMYLLLDNTNQAANLIREYIIYTNNAVKSDIYSDIVARWKLNFSMLQSIANSGNKQAGEYLNLMKNVVKLDDKLQSYSFAVSPIVKTYNDLQSTQNSKLKVVVVAVYVVLLLWLIIFMLLAVVSEEKRIKNECLDEQQP